MRDYIEKIKIHIEKHKMVYSCAATAVGVAGITALIMRGRYANLQSGFETPDTKLVSGYMRPLTFFSNKTSNTMVTVVEREGRGHPGYLVRCLETNEIFPSQTQAANTLGLSSANLSSHLNGKFPDIEGLHFERITLSV